MTTYYAIDTINAASLYDIFAANFEQLAAIILGIDVNNLHQHLNLQKDFDGDEDAAISWCLAVNDRMNKNSNYVIHQNLTSLLSNFS